MKSVLPQEFPASIRAHMTAKEGSPSLTIPQLIEDVESGILRAPMSIRISPHILSLIDWNKPLDDPLFRQFIPLASQILPDHPKISMDSLDETHDSPVKGLVHRYPDKALFLGISYLLLQICTLLSTYIASSVCPVYCRFCTRSYSVGVDTKTVTKIRFLPIHKKWEAMFDYIEKTPSLCDIVISGGDSFSLSPPQMDYIGRRLLSIPHISRMRFASKGLNVYPSRLLDPHDDWAKVLISLSNEGRLLGKSVALHTHFNHPQEITWITAASALKLHQNGVVVRNQTILLNGINNDVATMSLLIRRLAELNIQPVSPC